MVWFIPDFRNMVDLCGVKSNSRAALFDFRNNGGSLWCQKQFARRAVFFSIMFLL
jgi:hypothetical protein